MSNSVIFPSKESRQAILGKIDARQVSDTDMCDCENYDHDHNISPSCGRCNCRCNCGDGPRSCSQVCSYCV